jgi:hypothetical protein
MCIIYIYNTKPKTSSYSCLSYYIIDHIRKQHIIVEVKFDSSDTYVHEKRNAATITLAEKEKS